MESYEVNAIAKYMPPQNVLLDLDVADRAGLFDAIGRHIEGAHRVQHKLVVNALARRELAGSTGLGEGLAIPHARIEGLGGIQVLYARLKTPIAFAAPDRKPVSEVLVLLVPYPASEEHLELLSVATQMFSAQRFREDLRASVDPREVVRLFFAWPDGARAEEP
jgi:PTS system nitrogen regulatory IIA component